MPETVICAPVRTAVGRYGGVFKDVPAAAGLPVEVPGVQLDRRCGSGLQAVIWAVMQVQTGAIEVVLAGGAESMSQVEFYSPSVRWGPGGEQIVFHDRLGRVRVTAGGIHDLVPGGMLETAENLRREYQITRAEQDEFALRSHQRAVAAQEAGRFDDEIVPVEVPDLRRAGTGRPVRAGCLRQP
jgi:acetyl-CoA C-acetyltransferase